MDIYEEVNVPARTEKRKVKTVCDICKQDTAELYEKGRYNWFESEITVSYRGGEVCPEGGSGTEIKVDLCRYCFKEILVPFLKSQGAAVIETEWET